jgi:hypothetical protein
MGASTIGLRSDSLYRVRNPDGPRRCEIDARQAPLLNLQRLLFAAGSSCTIQPSRNALPLRLNLALRWKQVLKISIFDCLRHTLVPKSKPDPRCQQFYEGYEVGELVRVNHERLVDEICVVVAVVDDVGPGIVPVWSPNFPDALYWKATPREVMRIASAKKTQSRIARRLS